MTLCNIICVLVELVTYIIGFFQYMEITYLHIEI